MMPTRVAQLAGVGLIVLGFAAPAAFGGGSIRGLALLPTLGRLAAVDVQQQRIAHLIPVPPGDGPIAASIDGSRVLVANTRRGIVTEVNSLTGRRVRTFSGLGLPVALQLLPNSTTSTGYVRPRYAVVADATGRIVMLDLDRGRIAAKAAVRAPIALALDGDQLWIASRGTTRLTLLSLANPARPRPLDRVDAGIHATALTVDSAVAAGVDAISRDGRFEQINGVTLARSSVARIPGRVTQLLAGYEGDVWIATSSGRVYGIDAASGQATGLMRLPLGTGFAVSLGELLVVVHGDRLGTYGLGLDRQAWRATVLPARASSVAYAVL